MRLNLFCFVLVVLLCGCQDYLDFTSPTGSARYAAGGGGFGTIQGQVYDTHTQRGIANARVVAAGVAAWSNGFGYFELPNVAAGSDSIRATKTGYHDGYGVVSVEPGTTIHYSIEMIPY